MGILFGTDGIRGFAGEPPLDHNTVHHVGLSLTEYLKNLSPQPHILIARDTRVSGPWIEAVLQSAIKDAGGVSEICGVLSTPAVSFLTTQAGAHAGVMISASHNPYQDNGIKIFSSSGVKFNDAVENELERKILTCSSAGPSAIDPVTWQPILRDVPRYSEAYKRHLRQCLPPDFLLSGTRLVVDCAHGALSIIGPSFLGSLGATVTALHCSPDGRNINFQAGALHPERLQEEVKVERADLGVAFDGDADRAVFVDSSGRQYDGDDVLYILARYSRFTNAPAVVVGTVMANLGLELALKDIGLSLVRTAVGDRYVLEEMLRQGAAIGGEQSGHVILTRLARTGDGLLTAIKLLEILREQQSDMATLARPLIRFPQVLINVRVRKRVPFECIPELAKTQNACKNLLGDPSRILLRYSGTEKLARVMVEAEDEGRVKECAQRIASILESFQPDNSVETPSLG